MSFFEFATLMGFSIIIAAIIGCIRFNSINSSFYPFVLVVIGGFCNHTLSFLLIKFLQSNTVNGNIYVLLESLCYLWLFINWKLFNKKLWPAFALMTVLLCIWILDNLIIHSLYIPNALFRIVSSLIIVFCAVEQLVQLIPKAKGNLLKNAIFIICSGLLLHFSFKACIEVFFLISKNVSLHIQTNIYSVLIYVNCFVNLLFAWAMIWIPRKQQYLLLR